MQPKRPRSEIWKQNNSARMREKRQRLKELAQQGDVAAAAEANDARAEARLRYHESNCSTIKLYDARRGKGDQQVLPNAKRRKLLDLKRLRKRRPLQRRQ